MVLVNGDTDAVNDPTDENISENDYTTTGTVAGVEVSQYRWRIVMTRRPCCDFICSQGINCFAMLCFFRK